MSKFGCLTGADLGLIEVKKEGAHSLLFGSRVPHRNQMLNADILEPQGTLFAPGDIPAPKTSDPKNVRLRDNLIEEIFSTDVLAASALAFVPKAFTYSSFPYQQPKNPDGTLATHYVRQTKRLCLTLSTANASLGLPYGCLPRLLLAYMTNQAKMNATRTIDLCRSISELLALFQLKVTGGKTGTIARMRHQLRALTSTTVNFEWAGAAQDNHISGMVLFPIIESAVFWEKNGSSELLDGSYVRLSEYFFNEIKAAVPVDMRALLALKKSPLAMDLYTFLTYRVYSLSRPTTIPWAALHSQFGYDYARMRDFKAKVKKAMASISIIYDTLKFELTDRGLLIYPSPTHVPRRKTFYVDLP